MGRFFVSITVLLALNGSLAGAQESNSDQRVIRLYEAPKIEEQTELRYPPSASRVAHEGWVELNFMVDPEGNAYEVMVSANAGDEVFVEAAKEHLQEIKFRPARLDNEVVDGSSRIMYRFEMEEASDAARPSFVSNYRKFMRTLREDSEEEASIGLNRLQQSDISNNYEYAYWNLARFFYAERYGSPLEQMENLQLALGESIVRPEYESYLGDDAQLLRRRLFELQINNRRYAEGLATVELMRQRGDDEGVALFDEALTQLEVLRSNDQAYGLTGQLGEDGLWFVDLFKDDFYLDDLSGKVEELKLRCEGSYVFFDFDPEVQYHVSERAGECTLEIVGDPDTTFTLVQA